MINWSTKSSLPGNTDGDMEMTGVTGPRSSKIIVVSRSGTVKEEEEEEGGSVSEVLLLVLVVSGTSVASTRDAVDVDEIVV